MFRSLELVIKVVVYYDQFEMLTFLILLKQPFCDVVGLIRVLVDWETRRNISISKRME